MAQLHAKLPTPTDTGAMVRKFLDLSNHHLPHDLGIDGLSGEDGVTAYGTDTGWLMWVPDDPDEWANDEESAPPAVVLEIQRYARALDCDYVLFDVDGNYVAGLERFDW